MARNISGRYRSAGSAQQLHLRVDVGRGAPVDSVSGTRLGCLSGDLFDLATGKCIGSFIARKVIRKSATVVEGAGTDGSGAFESLAAGPTVRVTVRLSSTRPGRPVSARVEFLDSGGEEVVPARVCGFVDRDFREVSWQLVVLGETGEANPFESFDTKLKYGEMTVARAFKRAGFKLTGGTVLRIENPEATADDLWSDAELHAAMQEHCRSWRDQPQWNVCVLAAPEHEDRWLRGVMFDRAGDFPRQGCAVFSAETDWGDQDQVRDQLHDYAHEIGHCFNLPHCWDREYGAPLLRQGPNQGYGELSWMNYPLDYAPAGGSPGATAYWQDFEFRFAPTEVNYLRHALHDDIVPGGRPFLGASSASSAVVHEQAFEPRATDAPDLELELRSSRNFVLGEPVVVEVKLVAKGPARPIHARLHPRYGNVQIGIRHAGRLRRYRPPIVYCAGKNQATTLGVESPPVYTSAYLGFGREGLYFKDPGRYELVACYVAPDGSRVVTDPKRPLVLDIASPHQDTPLDAEVTKLLMGEQQGMLFWLGGSDKLDEIAAGRVAFGKLLKDKFCRHPLAPYLKFVEGINLGRSFKRRTPDGRISIRPANAKVSARVFSEFVEGFRNDLTFDNLTLNFGMRRLARSLHLAGRLKEAGEMLDSVLPTFVDRVSKERKAKGEPQVDVDKKIGDKIRKQVEEERKVWSQLDAKKGSSRA